MIRVQLGNKAAKEFSEDELQAITKELDAVDIGKGVYSVLYKNKSHEISIQKLDYITKTVFLTIDGIQTQVKCANKIDLLVEKMGIDTSASQKMTILKAPMPGLVVDWLVKEGDVVQAGDKLLILEAMKMENIIKSVGEGTIKKLHVAKGVAVEKNQVLIDFA